jgi:hypothetical protein
MWWRTCNYNTCTRGRRTSFLIFLMMGAWRPKHVEWLCINKTCTVLHQVGVLFDLLLHNFAASSQSECYILTRHCSGPQSVSIRTLVSENSLFLPTFNHLAFIQPVKLWPKREFFSFHLNDLVRKISKASGTMTITTRIHWLRSPLSPVMPGYACISKRIKSLYMHTRTFAHHSALPCFSCTP